MFYIKHTKPQTKLISMIHDLFYLKLHVWLINLVGGPTFISSMRSSFKWTSTRLLIFSVLSLVNFCRVAQRKQFYKIWIVNLQKPKLISQVAHRRLNFTYKYKMAENRLRQNKCYRQNWCIVLQNRNRQANQKQVAFVGTSCIFSI